MATGGTAPLIAMPNPSHSLLDQDSSVSSPLSEVEDKDGEPDEMDIDMNSNHSEDDEPVDRENGRADAPTNHVPNDDSESNLSDIETNDSEAETERLYDTPRKDKSQQGNTTSSANNNLKFSSDNHSRAFQRSPSKLQEQIRTVVDAESGDVDNDEASDEQHDADDEDKASVTHSEADSDKDGGENHRKAPETQRNKSQESHIVVSSTIVINHSDDSSAESRKRKRSTLRDQSDANQPLRKRTGSVVEPGDESSSLSKVMSEDLEPSHPPGGKSAEQSGDEDDEDTAMKGSEDVAESVEKHTNETSRSKKSKRSNTKKRKGSEDEVAEDCHEAEELVAEDGQAAEDERVQAGVDEEAEAAHKNEEEMERKRNAFAQLSSIEKNFAVLRDRLYEERLAQLNEEEAMLTSDNPTHPEYVAMMQCIDSRRDERLRIAELGYKFDMDALDRWAVARRSQILSQFYQSIRETREKTLDELGRQWYEIQHERRRNANPISDFGFRFPKTKTQQKRHAIAHSKETSILAGIAQHHGFPAAPDMKGATPSEIEEDFEAMHRARQGVMASAHHTQAAHEYGAVTFGRNLGPTNLGPAGEQFLEQTPWANPKHPSHHVASRRHSHSAYAGPPNLMGYPKATQQAGWFANGQVNGDSGQHKHATTAVDKEPVHARKAAETAKSKREAIVL